MPFGLPILFNAAQNKINKFQILVSDINIFPGLFGRTRWGLYRNNQPVIVADSVAEIDYRQEWRLPQYPMEQGAFQSYNKVETPYLGRVRLTKGGSASDRATFIAAVEAAAASLDLYDIVSPEKVYTGANISRIEYRRNAASGAGLITVDLLLTQVRETVVTAFTNTATPSGANPVNGGSVQPQAPTAAEVAGIQGFD
jgi:hypothetical protein